MAAPTFWLLAIAITLWEPLIALKFGVPIVPQNLLQSVLINGTECGSWYLGFFVAWLKASKRL